MEYLKAFAVGGAFCVIGQILIDKTKLTPARILVSYVVIGVILGGIGLYEPLTEFAGAGASVPLTGFGNLLAKGVKEAVDEKASNGSVGQTAAETGGRSEEYVTYLENKLEEVLSQMDGVGRVEVMITVSDGGESVVEKDRASTATTTTENDSAGGSRTISEQNAEEQTIYVETENETYPYVQKENLPTVIGVVVVAEGGGNSTVISDISDAVEALLPVEAHRIKVVKMCSKED